MYSQPSQASKNTQTEPQAPPAPPACIPLQMVDEDGKKRYCYHGGKCRCEVCEIIRRKQQDELDRNLDAFISDGRLKVVPGVRHAKQKQYSPQALRLSPEMGLILLKDYITLTSTVPIYNLPDKYYTKAAWTVFKFAEAGTQTETVIGNYGVDGCPCPDKSVCWDL